MSNSGRKNSMVTVKVPDGKDLSKYPKHRRVVAVIGNGQHGLAVVRSLGMNGLCVLAVCKTPYGRSCYSRYSTGAWALDVPPDQPEFIDEIEKLAREYDAGSITTLSEVNHLALIENRDRFEPDIHVLSPSEDAFKKTLDKEYMRTLCEKIGVPVAKGMVLADFLKMPEQKMSYPRILRTRHKHGEDADRNAPWLVAYAKNEKEFKEYVDEVSSITDNVLVEECFAGVTRNVNVLIHKGEVFTTGSSTGELHYPVAGGVTVQRVSCDAGETYPHAFNLLSSLGYEGNAIVAFRCNNETGDFIFTEINPRFGGSLPTIVRAGFHVPFLLWQSHFEPDKMKVPRYRIGLRTRSFKGSLACLRGILRGELVEPGYKQPSKIGAVASFLWNCGPWTYDDLFRWRDPMPYIMERLGMVVPHLPGVKKLWRRKHK